MALQFLYFSITFKCYRVIGLIGAQIDTLIERFTRSVSFSGSPAVVIFLGTELSQRDLVVNPLSTSFSGRSGGEVHWFGKYLPNIYIAVNQTESRPADTSYLGL